MANAVASLCEISASARQNQLKLDEADGSTALDRGFVNQRWIPQRVNQMVDYLVTLDIFLVVSSNGRRKETSTWSCKKNHG